MSARPAISSASCAFRLLRLPWLHASFLSLLVSGKILFIFTNECVRLAANCQIVPNCPLYGGDPRSSIPPWSKFFLPAKHGVLKSGLQQCPAVLSAKKTARQLKLVCRHKPFCTAIPSPPRYVVPLQNPVARGSRTGFMRPLLLIIANLPLYMHRYIDTKIYRYIHTYVRTYIHAYKHTHTHIHTYIHTYNH